jgi:hypothetical protein
MRRVLLTLFFITSLALSQPAQQQAQTPIVVQVQMPPESILTAILKVAIPAILAGAVGAGRCEGIRVNGFAAFLLSGFRS